MRIPSAVLALLLCLAWGTFAQTNESAKPQASGTKKRPAASTQEKASGTTSTMQQTAPKASPRTGKKATPKRKPTDLSTSAEALEVDNQAPPAPGQEGTGEAPSTGTVENEAEKILDPEAKKWEGFRGVKWCTDAAEVEGMVRFAGMENSSVYRRAKDVLSIGAARLEDIRYYFSRDGFYAVQLLAVGAANFDLLKKALDERFGEQGMKDRTEEDYTWTHEPGSEYAVKCTLKYDWVTESTVIVLSYAASEKRIKERLKYKRTNFVVKRSAEAVEDAQEGF